jgi:hypothetical protein
VICARREQLVVRGVHRTGKAVDGPILPTDVPLPPPQKNRILVIFRIIIAGFCKQNNRIFFRPL